ncbi:hypothetical protein AVEN_130020-1 [Araneus ventricosus]|uniref:Uncharacterized protein n=1 Tax=Araneus ventricosus TaxID=182803 RepID=A0A4Y2N4I1_ARAVE|nr:hypothetical protein AVEN_130020-1 [Araneus ventricosus]
MVDQVLGVLVKRLLALLGGKNWRKDEDDKTFDLPWSLRASHGQHREDGRTPCKILLVIPYKFISMKNYPKYGPTVKFEVSAILR